MTHLSGNAVPAWLSALSLRGSFLRLTADGCAEAFSPRNGFSGPVASADARALAVAVAAGWLIELDAGRLGPSALGIAAIRATRSEAAAELAAKPRDVPARPAAGPTDVSSSESPLAWLRRRRDKDGKALISEAEFDAGERLRADFWFAQMTPRITSSWNAAASSRSTKRGAPGAGVEMRDNVVAAQERVRRALRAVGPELSGILIDICCHLKGIEDAERSVGWPQRSGKVVLQLALTRLARHYGLLPPESDERSAARTPRHWGAPGYRPTADHW